MLLGLLTLDFWKGDLNFVCLFVCLFHKSLCYNHEKVNDVRLYELISWVTNMPGQIEDQGLSRCGPGEMVRHILYNTKFPLCCLISEIFLQVKICSVSILEPRNSWIVKFYSCENAKIDQLVKISSSEMFQLRNNTDYKLPSNHYKM